ncbi:MAG TPA: hypothetical protein VK841_19420 [Polyangiaceae bacterium]|jgi:hypothetical protein|nr:hypothetical protein [Polyangiaceae bacterium]
MNPLRVHEDVVVLVPGFLGFSIIGQFPYFADRVPGVLGALLREKWGREVSIVAATTVPTGPLQARILRLAAFLGRLAAAGARRLHLVGHSTGGVDAQLLMSVRPFWGGEWSGSVADARRAVVSVATISAPHFGTALLESSAARFLEQGSLCDALPFLRAAGPLLSLAVKDMSQLDQLLNLNAKQLPTVWRFVFSVVRHHELLEELRPAAMEGVRARTAPDPNVKLTCFVSGADTVAGPRPSDPFYSEIVAFCRIGAQLPPTPAMRANIERLCTAPPSLWIRDPATAPYSVDAGTSDGVVNTARQLLEGAELGGIVLGDHADVIGDYDRFDVASEQLVSAGIFRSGASFSDDQLLELYRRVAAAV